MGQQDQFQPGDRVLHRGRVATVKRPAPRIPSAWVIEFERYAPDGVGRVVEIATVDGRRLTLLRREGD